MTIQFLKLSIAGVLVRFYLMMGVVVLAGFIGVWPIALLALPIFVSIMLGITFGTEKSTTANKSIPLKVRKAHQKAS